MRHPHVTQLPGLRPRLPRRLTEQVRRARHGREPRPLLIDAGFTRADGHRLVAAVLDSGKTLTTVFVSHADPDFYFGARSRRGRLPRRRARRHPDRHRAHPARPSRASSKAWAALGANLPTRPGGADTADRRPHSRSMATASSSRGGSGGSARPRTTCGSAEHRAILGGVLAVPAGARLDRRHRHPGEACRVDRPARRDGRRSNPQLVVPGHRLPGTPNDASALTVHPRRTCSDFESVTRQGSPTAPAADRGAGRDATPTPGC